MRSFHYSLLLLFLVGLTYSCSDSAESNTQNDISEEDNPGYQYIDSMVSLSTWGPQDYDDILYNIRMNCEPDDYPQFDNPISSRIIKKLVDPRNFEHILNDTTLGIVHRSQEADQFFERTNELNQLYSIRDEKDQFVYDQELVSILIFSLDFFTENARITLANLDELVGDPESLAYQQASDETHQILIHNFEIYLDYIHAESAFGHEAIKQYTDGIDQHFSLLLEEFPDGNYLNLKAKVIQMMEKTEHAELKASLLNLVEHL